MFPEATGRQSHNLLHIPDNSTPDTNEDNFVVTPIQVCPPTGLHTKFSQFKKPDVEKKVDKLGRVQGLTNVEVDDLIHSLFY